MWSIGTDSSITVVVVATARSASATSIGGLMAHCLVYKRGLGRSRIQAGSKRLYLSSNEGLRFCMWVSVLCGCISCSYYSSVSRVFFFFFVAEHCGDPFPTPKRDFLVLSFFLAHTNRCNGLQHVSTNSEKSKLKRIQR